MKTFRISGQVITRSTGKGVKGLRVEAWDKDLIFDDLVGSDTTDEMGNFRIQFDETHFKDLFLERRPDLFFKVFRGDEFITSTEDAILWNEKREDIEIEIILDGLEKKVELKLGCGIRRLLRMTDEEILKETEKHEAILQKKLKVVKEMEEMQPPPDDDRDRLKTGQNQYLYRADLLPHPIFGSLIIDKLALVPIKARAIIRFTGNRDDLIAMGLEVNAQAHDIYTVIGTKQQLTNLATQPAARSVRLPRLLLPHVENATAQGEVSAVHQPRPVNPTGFQGQGVFVGIVDSELDVTHHGFRNPTATAAGAHETRLEYYWVQQPDAANAPGQTPEQFYNANIATRPNFTGLNYGRIYTRGDINTALGQANTYGNGNNQISCVPGNEEHGTHVAGIAAGSGHMNNWNTAPVHIGSAPQSTMIHVTRRFSHANVQNGTWEDDVINAIDFIFRTAQFNNMPAVVNVSLGSSLGPHNGKSEFDQARDNLLNSFQERSIVWSAGNDNDNNGYRNGTIANNATETFTLTPGWAAGNTQWLDIWYTGPELDFQVECGGTSCTWRTAGNEFHGTLNGYTIDVDRAVESGGGLQSIRLYIINATTGDPWIVRLRNPHNSNSVRYYAWVGLQGWWGDITGNTQNELTLSDTGCSKSILTVGACAKRNPANPAVGEIITAYSGAGPTVDGRIKPEIVAVGGTWNNPATAFNESIISTNSNQASGYVGMSGTSMASPLVAGAVALLFEEGRAQNRPMTQDTIKALLIQNTNSLNLNLDPTQPGFVQQELDRYGYGRLRLIGPIDHIRPALDVDVWIRTADDDYGDEPYPGGSFCRAPDIEVFQSGTTNEISRLNWGTTYDVRTTVRNLGNDAAVGTIVRLKYTLPGTAPNNWVQAEDASNVILEQTVTVPALGQVQHTFHWRPEKSEFSSIPAGQTHFCLLAEVHHVRDPLVFAAPATSNAWTANIKGNNNVALRNLHIQ